MKTKTCYRCQRPFARENGFETHQAGGGGLVFVCWSCYKLGLSKTNIEPSTIGELHMRFAFGHFTPLEAANISEAIRKTSKKRARMDKGCWRLIYHYGLDIAFCIALLALAHIALTIFSR